MLRRRLITVCLLLPLSMAVMASPLLSEGVGERLSIAPLTTSHWHQNAPYNGLCPVVADGNLKTAAGCVAIAAAQIIYYWRDHNPATTTYDTPTYPYGKAPVTYSVPAGTPYEWELMKDSYTVDDSEASRDAVARLVYVIGTSAWLSYGATTGGSIYDVINPLVSQFQMTAQYATKNVFSQEEWEELLYQELANGRPVLYAGTKNGSGHAVVIDGYDATRRLFHFNSDGVATRMATIRWTMPRAWTAIAKARSASMASCPKVSLKTRRCVLQQSGRTRRCACRTVATAVCRWSQPRTWLSPSAAWTARWCQDSMSAGAKRLDFPGDSM